MRLLKVLGVLLLSTITSAETPSYKISDIFTVDTRDPNVHPSSCLLRLDPNDPSTQVYDPDAGFDDRTHLLNKFWWWVDYIVQVAQVGISTDTYEQHSDARKLMYSFFGIKQGPADADSREPSLHTLDRQKLDQVRSVYQAVLDVISRPSSDEKEKPRLFCDHTFVEWQDGSENARDKNGNPIKKPNSDDFYTLREWELEHGRDMNYAWYFWIDALGVKGYLVNAKADPNAPHPYVIDPRTNKPNLCSMVGFAGVTYGKKPPGLTPMPGTEAWLDPRITVLCPHSFRQFPRSEPDLTKQPEGTHLDKMGASLLTLLHELFHLARRDVVDNKAWWPKYDFQARRVDPNFPLLKSSFDDYRHAYSPEGQGVGALQSLTLALYEQAQPETTDFNQLTSLHTAENYAWFGFTLFMMYNTKQDWSTGAARAPGSDWSIVTAQIPVMGQPGAKFAPVTRNSTDVHSWPVELEKDVTKMWRNVTESMGPITAMDEWTTFVTSVKARL